MFESGHNVLVSIDSSSSYSSDDQRDYMRIKLLDNEGWFALYPSIKL